MTSPVPHRIVIWPIAAAAASMLLIACGSSSKAATAPAAPAASNASVTVRTAAVAGLGTVLVNGDGLTLYVLAQEKGGKVTCVATGGCTKYWPPAVLPSGMSHGIAGAGVQASLLGTVMSPSGDTRLTYAGWPLYTYVGDSGPGTAAGQGFKDSFGTWWALDPSGKALITSAAAAPTTAGNGGGTSTTVPTGGGGVGY